MHSNKVRRVAANERWRMALKYSNFDVKEVAVLGESKEDVMRSRERCKANGIPVYGEFVWDGPVPPDSYVMVAPTVHMSTPEYFAFRMSNVLDASSAVHVVAELLSNVRTALTCHSMDDDTYNDLAKLDGPRMGAAGYREYLMPVADTPEGIRALTILETAVGFVGEFEGFVRTNLTEVED